MIDDMDAAVSGALDALFLQSGRDEAIQSLHTFLVAEKLLSKVTLHKYICRQKGCQIATVFRAAGLTLCAVRDNKLSPGLNEAVSVEAARAKNTLDGARHWPGHVYEVDRLAVDPRGGMEMECRHRHGAVLASDVLAVARGISPGHPGAPSRI